MRDKTIDFNAQAGGGVKAICDAIEGLKAWKREYKEKTGMDLDISGDLKAIRSNLNDLKKLTEESEEDIYECEHCNAEFRKSEILHREYGGEIGGIAFCPRCKEETKLICVTGVGE